MNDLFLSLFTLKITNNNNSKESEDTTDNELDYKTEINKAIKLIEQIKIGNTPKYVYCKEEILTILKNLVE